MFLTADELKRLTGRSRADAQIAALRRMGIPFWVNAASKPVVARAAVRDEKATTTPTPAWEPRNGPQA